MKKAFAFVFLATQTKESVSGISKAGSPIDESLLADLQFRTETYKTPTPFQYPLSPIEGAEQAVSAISKGYDIIDYAGGLGMAEKVPHILQYFRDNPAYLPKKKPKFWGFSGATHSVVLHEILEPVCSPNLFMINEFRGKSENIDFALKAMRGEVDSRDQKLIPINAIAEKKYNANYTQPKDENISMYFITAHTLEHNLHTANEFRPPEDKKFILGFESMMVPPHLVLEKTLARYQELGILGNLQHIELGEVVPLGMDELPQRNGQIDISAIKSGDAFDATGRDKLLRKIGFDKVALKAISDSDKDILFTENLEKIQEKVQEFNLQIKQEQQAIIEVANYYEVPILASPDRRSGHATGVLVDPSGTQNKLSVNENGIIIRTTALESIDPPKQPAAVRPIPSQSLSPEERVAFSQEPKIDEGNNRLHPKKSADVDIGSIPVIPLNESARVMLKQDPDLSLNVRGGIMSNAIQDQADVDKGMLLINGSYTVADALQDALLKGRMGKSDLGEGCPVPFVIFASNKTGSQEQELIAKTVTLNNVETPVFFAPNRLENLPDLFTGKLHIKQHQIMPKNPLVLDEISNSSPKERQEETWPIMSTSKAFCGALLTSSANNFLVKKESSQQLENPWIMLKKNTQAEQKKLMS